MSVRRNQTMHRFKLIIAISVLAMSFVSCSAGKIRMVGTNYEFRNNYFSIEIVYENQTDKVLIFPYAYFASSFHPIYEEKSAIVIDECNANFKNLEEMVNMQLKETPINKNDNMSYLQLLAVQPGQRFIYSKTIPYSKFPKQKILDKGQVKIHLDFGMANEIEYDNFEKIIASGPVKKHTETIKLVVESRNDLGELPTPTLFPFCNLEDCVYFEKIKEPFLKFD